MSADGTITSKCSKCGAEGIDLRCGVCYDCATRKESERCERDGHEYDDRPGTAFYDRCVWCDLPRGVAKRFTESHGDTNRVPSSYDRAGVEAYLSKMPGAKFVQPPPKPPPPGYWTAPCDNGCARGTKYNYDMHGSYEVYCGKCEDGTITAKSLADWLKRQEGPDYF